MDSFVFLDIISRKVIQKIYISQCGIHTPMFSRNIKCLPAVWPSCMMMDVVKMVVVVRWKQDKNDKEARQETEGESGRVHRRR